jgi:signal transduction histidine kinase/CheY-like chemotaxis protein
LLYRGMRLRTKFLLSLLAIMSGFTAATLLVVSYSVERRVRDSLREELSDSIKTYQTFDQQRDIALTRSAGLLANLPIVRALMTTQDIATIQDGSESIWKLSGSDLMVLVNRSGEVVGLQGKTQGISREKVQELLRNSASREASRAWWFAGGRLYQVRLQPIYFGAAGQDTLIGLLGVAHEIDAHAAQDFKNIVSSEIVFQCGVTVVASTLDSGTQNSSLAQAAARNRSRSDSVEELQIGSERYLKQRVELSSPNETPVALTVLRSLDKATGFLNRLNHILLGLGLVSILTGGALVFMISHTFTRPLSNLVSGVQALENGNYDFPLDERVGGEAGQVTGAFDRMRTNLRKTLAEQQQLENKLRQSHKMEAVGRLAGGVAHDFNNLLTVIRGNSDLLLDRGSMDQLQHKNVEQIQKAADRAVSMTRQLLAFSRMQVLQPRVLDLNATISEMNKMIPRLIGEHIEFGFTPEPKVATVLADPGQIEQVFLNLAVNARDAMPSGGKLIVRTSNVTMGEAEARQKPPMSPGDYVLLSVSDTGHGMDAETKARIFEPFFTTKEVGKGTGLGLATVYGIVKQTGGFIWVESSPGVGATFEIYLPATARRISGTDADSKPKTVPGGTETILVVEDEAGVRELASEFLRAAGYKVFEASDGASALKTTLLHGGTIDLLLTDMVMPVMNGSDLARKVSQAHPAMRVVFMTGYSEFPSNTGEKDVPDISILQKPFSRPTLLQKVREILSAPRPTQNASKVEGPA